MNAVVYVHYSSEGQQEESNEFPACVGNWADTDAGYPQYAQHNPGGIFNASTKRRLDDLEATEKAAAEHYQRRDEKKSRFTREQIQLSILQFRKVNINTLEGRRRLIDGFVNSVVVYDDYILVTFNYKEGAERIIFEQSERSDLSSLGGPDSVFYVPKRSHSSGYLNYQHFPG